DAPIVERDSIPCHSRTSATCAIRPQGSQDWRPIEGPRCIWDMERPPSEYGARLFRGTTSQCWALVLPEGVCFYPKITLRWAQVAWQLLATGCGKGPSLRTPTSSAGRST